MRAGPGLDRAAETKVEGPATGEVPAAPDTGDCLLAVASAIADGRHAIARDRGLHVAPDAGHLCSLRVYLPGAPQLISSALTIVGVVVMMFIVNVPLALETLLVLRLMMVPTGGATQRSRTASALGIKTWTSQMATSRRPSPASR